LFVVLAIAWSYLAFMSVEFFCRDWLKARPVVYLLTHMGIMPLVDFFGTACEWLPRDAAIPRGLGWFLAASFFNGIVIETGRKLRQPAAEEQGVETYSFLWGKSGGAAVWLAAMSLTFLCATRAGMQIGFLLPVACALSLVLAAALLAAFRYVRADLPGKAIEGLTGAWTLTLYLFLGLIPLWLKS
jgi:4-hydroxybenzoate polyprenyltransferase